MTTRAACELAALAGALVTLAGCWWLHPGVALVVLGAGAMFVAGRIWQKQPAPKPDTNPKE